MELTSQGVLAVIGINPLHLHAQMDHQEHGHVHHDTLHQQWKLVATGEPEKSGQKWTEVSQRKRSTQNYILIDLHYRDVVVSLAVFH